MLSLISLVLSYLPYGVPGLIALWIGIKTEPPKRKPTDLASLECSTGFATKESWETERERVRSYLKVAARKKSKYVSVYDDDVDIEMKRLYGHAGRVMYNGKHIKEFDGPINDPLDLALSQELLPVEPIKGSVPYVGQYQDFNGNSGVVINVNAAISPTTTLYALQDQVTDALVQYGPVAENPHVYYQGGPPLAENIERDIIKMQIAKHRENTRYRRLTPEQKKMQILHQMNPTMYKPEDYIG